MIHDLPYRAALALVGRFPPLARLRGQRDDLAARLAAERRLVGELRAEASAFESAVSFPSCESTFASVELDTGPVDGTVRVRSRDEFRGISSSSAERRAYEDAVTSWIGDLDPWNYPAYCQPCRVGVVLTGHWRHSDGVRPNYRECLVCPRCGLNNRQRFVSTAVRAIEADLVPGLPLYVYEQVTPFYRWASHSISRPVIGSEYLGPGITGGTVIDGVRHEDALSLSFSDGELGMIVSSDVFEHVPDIDLALAEAWRVIAPGGILAFSIPFHTESDHTVQRAAMRDGEIVEYLPSVYHGNPVSDQGSLVFYDHGWDILDRCAAAGFSDAYGVAYWSALYAHIGGVQLMFVAEK